MERNLSQLEFHILNAMADGSEPFSMIYNEIVSNHPTHKEWNKIAIAKALCQLIKEEFVNHWSNGKRQNTEIDFGMLVNHYDQLEMELSNPKFSYYSKGEYFFEMSKMGLKEWDKKKYKKFYEEEEGVVK